MIWSTVALEFHCSTRFSASLPTMNVQTDWTSLTPTRREASEPAKHSTRPEPVAQKRGHQPRAPLSTPLTRHWGANQPEQRQEDAREEHYPVIFL
jgi:hypothetical protein